MTLSIDPVIGLCIGVMVFAAINAWLVVRPFERARRERKAQEHAAE
jgi:hypothetical protein